MTSAELFILALIVTIAGVVFFLFCLAIIILGKKIDTPGVKHQMIKIGNWFEVNGTTIILVTSMSAILIIGPLGFFIWKSNFIPKDEVSKNYIAKKDLTLDLDFILFLEDGRKADSVTVQLITIRGKDTDTITTGYLDGTYEFSEKIDPDVNYTLNFIRKGSPMNKFHYKFNKIRYPMTLIKN